MVQCLSVLMNCAERPHITEDGTRIPALRPKRSNPCSGVKRNHEQPRQRFLTPSELDRLADVLARWPDRVRADLISFLLLTGARFREATQARWEHINFELGVWTKPSSHTKQKREHVVYLSKPALMLLREIRERQDADCPCLFPGRFSNTSVGHIFDHWKLIRQEAGIEDVRIHGLEAYLRLGARQWRRFAAADRTAPRPYPAGHDAALCSPAPRRAARSRRTRRRRDHRGAQRRGRAIAQPTLTSFRVAPMGARAVARAPFVCAARRQDRPPLPQALPRSGCMASPVLPPWRVGGPALRTKKSAGG